MRISDWSSDVCSSDLVFADEDGNLRSEAMSDEQGNPVFCPRAIAARDALTEQLCALPPIATALNAIIEHFGTEEVAEVTGRTRRLVSEIGRATCRERVCQ